MVLVKICKQMIINRIPKINKWRNLKYLLLGSIIFIVLFSRRAEFGNYETYVTLFSFHGNYLTWTLAGISLLANIRIERFWCRYLCPYGALLGLVGLLSLGKIHRDPSHCTDCGKCEKKCPGMIPIRQKTIVHSLECSACLTCIESCPEKGALKFTCCAGRSSLPIFFLRQTLAQYSTMLRNSRMFPG